MNRNLHVIVCSYCNHETTIELSDGATILHPDLPKRNVVVNLKVVKKDDEK